MDPNPSNKPFSVKIVEIKSVRAVGLSIFVTHIKVEKIENFLKSF